MIIKISLQWLSIDLYNNLNKMQVSIDDDFMQIQNALPENIHELVIPEGVTILSIIGDYIDELVIPNGITTAYIESLGLKRLHVPDGLEYLHCSDNFIRTLELPSSLILLDAHDNLLKKISFRSLPHNCTHMDIRLNRMINLDFPLCQIEDLNASLNFDLEYISPEIEQFLIQQCIPAEHRPKSPDDPDWFPKFLQYVYSKNK
jgi:hypothetical protein